MRVMSALSTVRTALVPFLVLAAAPLVVRAQPAGKMSAVGILGEMASDPSEARMWQTFRLGLRELGWIEGQNLRIESRWANVRQLSQCCGMRDYEHGYYGVHRLPEHGRHL